MTDCIFLKIFKSPGMLYALSSPVIEATDGGLKILLRLMMKCKCLEVTGCCSSTTMQEVCGPLGCFFALCTTWLC